MTAAEEALIATARRYVTERAQWVIGNKNSDLGKEGFDVEAFPRAKKALDEAVNDLAREMGVAVG